mmetsp:Transcript_5139/g.13725  ORF Transcript_5139/g.13725 Transcript_5139/m.13725 type:complete len:232 (+) Transcript_5139:128-823(+)
MPRPLRFKGRGLGTRSELLELVLPLRHLLLEHLTSLLLRRQLLLQLEPNVGAQPRFFPQRRALQLRRAHFNLEIHHLQPRLVQVPIRRPEALHQPSLALHLIRAVHLGRERLGRIPAPRVLDQQHRRIFGSKRENLVVTLLPRHRLGRVASLGDHVLVHVHAVDGQLDVLADPVIAVAPLQRGRPAQRPRTHGLVPADHAQNLAKLHRFLDREPYFHHLHRLHHVIVVVQR